MKAGVARGLAAVWLGACGAAVAGLACGGGGASSPGPGADASTDAGAPGDATHPDAAEAGVVRDAALDAPSEQDAAEAAACVGLGTFGATHGAPFTYGRHYPNGAAAVDYAYGPSGTWGALGALAYQDNYYAACATSDHPADRAALLAAANGPPFTARDANCHLLWAADPSASDPQLGKPDAGFGGAFHEHSGAGVGGSVSGAPFTVFWFDDNLLARAMAVAYGRPQPDGLQAFGDFTRWSVLSGDSASWRGQPYGSAGNPTTDCCIDTMALNGLYDLGQGDFASAATEWRSILALSGASYDGATQRYLYPGITSNYQEGLFKVLTEHLLLDPGAGSSQSPTATTLLQHAVALDSDILDAQQSASTGPIGWTTDNPPGSSLINTETIACEVLGLGARANAVFEPGVEPLSFDLQGYFQRPYHVLSAVVSAGSMPGYMTLGPEFVAPEGTYAVDFRLRAPSPSGTVATLSIVDDVDGSVLVQRDVLAADLAPGNQWTTVTVTAMVPPGCHVLDLRTYWTGTANLDVGPLRVR